MLYNSLYKYIIQFLFSVLYRHKNWHILHCWKFCKKINIKEYLLIKWVESKVMLHFKFYLNIPFTLHSISEYSLTFHWKSYHWNLSYTCTVLYGVYSPSSMNKDWKINLFQLFQPCRQVVANFADSVLKKLPFKWYLTNTLVLHCASVLYSKKLNVRYCTVFSVQYCTYSYIVHIGTVYIHCTLYISTEVYSIFCVYNKCLCSLIV